MGNPVGMSRPVDLTHNWTNRHYCRKTPNSFRTPETQLFETSSRTNLTNQEPNNVG